MKSEFRQCPLCGLKSSHLHLKENFQPDDLNEYSFSSRKEPEPTHMCLYLCDACDLIYANPALDQSLIRKEYEDAAFDSSIEAYYAAKTYNHYLPKFGIISALDIGTGGGEFLLELKKAGIVDLQGIEPSTAAIETAHQDVRNFIRSGFFEESQYAENSFDLISCFQTLEHVFDPLALARKAHSTLRRGGKFFVVTHNFRGTINCLLGSRSPIYDIEHLQLFSPKSLREMLKKAGFREIRIFRIINTYPLFYWIKLLPFLPAKKHIIRLVKKIKFGYLPISLPIGNIGAIAIK